MTGVHSLLAGPDPRAGMESLADHAARLGPLPSPGADLIGTLERSGLRGRGGASFPVGTKWRAVAQRRRGSAVVLANGAEGEPLSHKDRLLMETRPHLVLDGAELAAGAVGAGEIVLYVGAEHARAGAAMARALAERGNRAGLIAGMVGAPVRYVSGEETAAVHFVNEGVALPTSLPPRPYEKGVGGRPTLVQNVESLAHAALIARFGDDRFRASGRDGATGTALVTVGGGVRSPGVIEVAQGTPIAEAVAAAGGPTTASEAVLLGGYFGGWVAADRAWGLGLDGPGLRSQGHSLGCGVVAVLPADRCGVVETARIMGYLAGESARQCGPCVFGLRAMADALGRVAGRAGEPDDLANLHRWAHQLAGRGACKHPDGAAGLMVSCFQVFADELQLHHQRRLCSRAGAAEGVA